MSIVIKVADIRAYFTIIFFWTLKLVRKVNKFRALNIAVIYSTKNKMQCISDYDTQYEFKWSQHSYLPDFLIADAKTKSYTPLD